jgi:hypothetical protein
LQKSLSGLGGPSGWPGLPSPVDVVSLPEGAGGVLSSSVDGVSVSLDSVSVSGSYIKTG